MVSVRDVGRARHVAKFAGERVRETSAERDEEKKRNAEATDESFLLDRREASALSTESIAV